MTKEELEKEVENKGVEYADKQKRTISVHEDSSYSWGQVEEAYERGALDFAEPREKRISELEEENKKMKSLLKEIYEEYGFCELVKIRNDLPTEIQETCEYTELKSQQINQHVEQLTKSKKYIRELLDFIKSKENGDGRTPTPYFYEEYEKFLKEIGE